MDERLRDVIVAAALRVLPMIDSGVEPRVDADEAGWVRSARGGDAEAFGLLIERHRAAARRTALAALGNQADAEEAVQDACLVAWSRLSSLDDPLAFRPWLLQITWRKALDRRRSVVRWLRRTIVTAGDAAEGEPWDLAAAAEGTQEETLLARERDLAIARVIRALPPKLRDPFLLAATGEHRYEDIAAMLRVPAGTVKWRMSEARRVIRMKLARLGFVESRDDA